LGSSTNVTSPVRWEDPQDRQQEQLLQPGVVRRAQLAQRDPGCGGDVGDVLGLGDLGA